MSGPPSRPDPTAGVARQTRLLLFLYSNRNLVGCLLAIGGLVLHFVGMLEHYWLAIVAGLYGIGYLAAPERREYVFTLGGELTAEAIGTQLAAMIKGLSGKVEPDVLERVQRIRESIDVLLPRLLAQESLGDKSLYIVRQTALEYLPTTLQTYLSLPAAFRRLHVVRDGKTPKALLLEQLDLLDAKMKEIVTSVAENDTQALLVNGRFLQEKFGTQGFLLGEQAKTRAS
ncbi:MAG TPA: hypothetical protein VJN39_11180 [Gemmatimonadales bacterium]|nr:hypothetical protein [Gemmatimonadales bacterium]